MRLILAAPAGMVIGCNLHRLTLPHINLLGGLGLGGLEVQHASYIAINVGNIHLSGIAMR